MSAGSDNDKMSAPTSAAVLVVDDEPGGRELLTRCFAAERHTRPCSNKRQQTHPTMKRPTIRRRVFLPVITRLVILTATITASFRWYQRLHEGDTRATVESAHALKGAAGTVTAEALRALAAEVEAAGNASDLTWMASLVEQLRAEAQRCLHFIPELQKRMNAF
jgi:CheY-like chemotaxis protein